MSTASDSGNERFSETHWKSLRYFGLYRLVVAAILFFSALWYPSAFPVLSAHAILSPVPLVCAYLVATALAAVVAYVHRGHSSVQLTASVVVDIVFITLLIHLGGGLGSGLGSLLLVTLAGAGLVGQGNLVLFYAAIAALSVLFEHSFRAIQSDFDAAGFFHAGVFSTGFFAVAVSARLLARRVIANEELARRRGVELNNQVVISQRVIEEVQDGVLVLSREGNVKQSNPRAGHLLALHHGSGFSLEACSPELMQGFLDWCRNPSEEAVRVRVPVTGLQLQARFVPTRSSESDVLVFLEDIGRLREQAQQMKLAALGRLTGNIAHEIRNPLSAISHAGELMQEERRGEMHERLLRIVLDNTRRLERIVSDVLELGRRDRAYPELIDLREVLPSFVEEYLLRESVDADVVEVDVAGSARLFFDRSHLHQVLWNLLGNALRHSQRNVHSVRLLVRDASQEAHVELHVIDDGGGVLDEHREQIFEPFFTTHHRGTGLGLHIVRELCEANGAHLELMNSQSGADFRVLGRVTECR